MKDPRIKLIADVLRGYTGDCICDVAYTSRRMIDPSCSYHIVPNEEAAIDIIAALDGTDGSSEEQPETRWNVFLFDPNKRFGDHMVTVHARTATEAEVKGLVMFPGSTIAHETVPSVYDDALDRESLHNPNEWGGLNGLLNS